MSQPDNSTAVKTDDLETPAATNEKSEIDHLRDLIFGNQKRVIDQRLAESEQRLAMLQQDFQITLDKRLGLLEETAASNLQSANNTLHQQLSGRLDQQNTALAAAQTDLQNQIQQTRQELAGQLEKLAQDLTAQMQAMQNTLRQDLQAATSRLNHDKMDQASWGQMLVELGQQLQKQRENGSLSS